MSTIRIRMDNGRPCVHATLWVDGGPMGYPFLFLVDTAAETSFICPEHLAQIKRAVEEKRRRLLVGLDNASPIRTVLGTASVMAFWRSNKNLGLEFIGVDHKAFVERMEYIYFSARIKKNPADRVWKRLFGPKEGIWGCVGEKLKYSILGNDILSRFTLCVLPSYENYGFLTNDTSELLRYLDSESSPLRGTLAACHDDGEPFQWITGSSSP